MQVKVKYLLREKAKEEMVKEGSPVDVYLVMTIGSRMVANMAIIVQNIIQGDNQDDVQSVALPLTTLLSVHVQSSPKPRMQSGKTCLARRSGMAR